ncbi:MAG: hypothetical protein AB7S50_04145 [Bacteroidales bacterium]
MEKTSIEILEDFANVRGIKCYSNSNTVNFSLIPTDRFMNTKYVVFELEKNTNELYFVFFDSFSPKAYNGINYSGFFKKIPECNNEIKVTKRFWFDFRKRIKSNDSYIDKKVTIRGENNKIDRNIINSKVIMEFLEINKIVEPLELETIRKSESNIPFLNGNNFIVIRTNTWVTEEKKLELFIDKGRELLNEIYI